MEKGKLVLPTSRWQRPNPNLTVRKDAVGDDAYEVFTKADLGDIVGVVGTVMVTNTGELSVKAEQFVHLTKALRPLPDKISRVNKRRTTISSTLLRLNQ